MACSYTLDLRELTNSILDMDNEVSFLQIDKGIDRSRRDLHHSLGLLSSSAEDFLVQNYNKFF